MKKTSFSSDPLPDDSVGQLGLPEERRLHARIPGHQDQGWPGSGGRGALQGGPELLLLLIRTSDPPPPPPISSPHLDPHPATPSAQPHPQLKQSTTAMFDSPPSSWSSILFPSAMFIKSCGLTPRGEENRGSGEKRQVQTEADASERESWPAEVELRYGTSVQKRLLPLPALVILGRRLVNVARLWWPRALSQHSLSTHSS